MKPLYRSRNGMIFGVCSGFAEQFDLSVNWIRFGMILGFIFTGFFPFVVAYIVLGLVMKKEPIAINDQEQAPSDINYYKEFGASRKIGLRQLRDKFASLESRIRRMEDHVTNRAYDWEQRFKAE